MTASAPARSGTSSGPAATTTSPAVGPVPTSSSANRVDLLYAYGGNVDLRGGPDQDKLVGGPGGNTCQKEDAGPLVSCGGP